MRSIVSGSCAVIDYFFSLSYTRPIYASNWETWLWLVRATTKLLNTSLPPSMLALSFTKCQFIQCMKNLSWCVDMMQPKILFILNCTFLQLFGWDLKSLWQKANQQQCRALFQSGSFGAAIEVYESIMDNIDEDMKADLHTWFIGKYSIMYPRLSVYDHQLHFTQLSRSKCFQWRWCSRSERLLICIETRRSSSSLICALTVAVLDK
jgi:hypothetical protein